MSAGDSPEQREVIAFLSRGESYGRPGEAPERIDTHISIVFLIGDRVYKLKRAVRFSFLDYSSVAAREHFCRVELALNRRTAPGIYLAVRAITRRGDGGLEWDGAGAALDWVVEMRRFAEADLLDRLAVAHRLTPPLMTRLADEIALFHAGAESVAGFGGSRGLGDVIAENHRDLIGGAPPLDRVKVEDLRAKSEAALTRLRDLLDRRQASGKIKRCHGDLHLRNICLIEGAPTLFDCIEFNDAIACIDVLYDLAFLLMDLEHRGLRGLGNIVLNRYLDRTDEASGLAALPLFLSVRAAVRAKVGIASLPLHPREALEDANAYLDLAVRLLAPATPRLIAIGGLSGTGKSTIAAGVAPCFAPAPGARVIRSDVLRKTLLQVAPETRLPQSAYGHEMNERVYRALVEAARMTVAAGYTAIVDATFIDAGQRREIAAIARAIDAPFTGLWLAAPESVVAARIDARKGDASDADRAVFARQLTADTGAIEWRQVDASDDVAHSIAAARRVIGI